MNMTIFYLFIYCMEGFIFFLYADRIFTVRNSRRACLLWICMLYGLLFLFSFSDLIWLKTISFFLANFLCLFLLFRVKWYTALFHTAFLTAVMGSSEVIVMGGPQHKIVCCLSHCQNLHAGYRVSYIEFQTAVPFDHSAGDLLFS